jgi:hypothetical protein
MTIDWTNIFKDIGCNVRQVNLFTKTVIPTDIVAESVKKVAQFTDGDERLAILSEMLAQDRANIDAVQKMADSVVDVVKSYITMKVGPVDFGSTYATLEEFLAEMEAKMTADSQTVDANAVSATTPVAGSGNYGTCTCGTVTPNQMAKTQNFRLECYQEAVGEETGALFHVYASKDGLLEASAEAGVEYDTGNAPGGVKFTIDAPYVQEFNDQADQCADWFLYDWVSGVVTSPPEKGVNTAADGKVYVSLTKISDTVYVKLYKDAARTELVGQGSYPNYQGTVSIDITPEEPSGLGGSVTVTWSVDDTDIYVIPAYPYRIGDIFTFSTTSDDAGTFQSFFRDYLRRAMPSDASGNETIEDAWAE